MRRRLTQLGPSALVVAAATLGGCEPWYAPSDTGDTQVAAGKLIVVPDDLSFATSVNDEGRAKSSFQLVNETGHDTTVFGFTDVDGDPVFTVGAGMQATVDLPADATIDVPVLFEPTAEHTYEASVTVRSVDLDDEVRVSLTGDGYAPLLIVDQDAVPDTTIGCTKPTALHLQNAGSEPLVLAGVDTAQLGDFSLEGDLPSEVPAHSTVTLALEFSPLVTGNHAGQLSIETNDPEHPRYDVDLTGIAVDDAWKTEQFHYKTGGGTEILLLVDDGSSGTWLQQVLDGLQPYLQALNAHGVDWRIAAVSTGSGCPLRGWGDANDPIAEVLDNLESTLDQPNSGAYASKLLDLAELAVDNAESGICMDGFISQGHTLQAIVVSDRDANGTAWADTVSAVEGQIQAQYVISGILPNSGCAETPAEYSAAIAGTGGGDFDLCATSWDGHWASLAEETASNEGGPQSITLSQAPLAATISVEVDGKPFNAWHVETDGRTIVLDQGPEVGATVSVNYIPASAC